MFAYPLTMCIILSIEYDRGFTEIQLLQIMKRQTIQLKLFAVLKAHMPVDADHYPIESGMTVDQLIDTLDIPKEQAKLVFINGRKADLTDILIAGDRVGVFPPVGGG